VCLTGQPFLVRVVYVLFEGNFNKIYIYVCRSVGGADEKFGCKLRERKKIYIYIENNRAAKRTQQAPGNIIIIIIIYTKSAGRPNDFWKSAVRALYFFRRPRRARPSSHRIYVGYGRAYIFLVFRRGKNTTRGPTTAR